MLLIVLISSANLGFAQIYTMGFDNGTGGVCATLAQPTVINAGLGSSDWTTSPAGCTSFGGVSGNALSATLTSAAQTFTLTFTNPGSSVSITRIAFSARRSGTGPSALAITAATAGCGTKTATVTNGTGNGSFGAVTADFTNFTSCTGAITIAIAYSAGSSGGTIRIDNIVITGTVANPVPTVSSISPTSATAGASATNVAVTGTNFVSGSTVYWNGAARTTTYNSATSLTAAITAADLASPGTGTITVVSPTPGGGTSSSSAAFTINHPVAVLTSISPTNTPALGAAFTLVLTGSNFYASSSVKWNGAGRTTTYISATEIRAAITAADIAAAGSAAVTVANPSPAAASGAQTFTISPAAGSTVPGITTASPASATLGGSAFEITLTGTNFVSGSIVRFNGSNRNTSYVSATSLKADITAADISSAGYKAISVINPNAEFSVDYPFTVNNPAPAIDGTTPFSPDFAYAASSAFTLTVNGSGFISGAVASWNGSARTTTFVSSTVIRASITAADIASAGTATITVSNPSPTTGASAGKSFTISPPPNPVPTLASVSPLSPLSATAGGSAFSLIVTGTNFISTSKVYWNGSLRTTTYNSATQLTANITAADIATAKTALITVNSPAPGGGTTTAARFVVNPVAHPVSFYNKAVNEDFTGSQGATAPTNWVISDANAFRGNAQTSGTSGGWYGNDNLSFLGSGSASNGTVTWTLQNLSGMTVPGFSFSYKGFLFKTGTANPLVTATYNVSATSTPGSFSALNSFTEATVNTTGVTFGPFAKTDMIPVNGYVTIKFLFAGGSSGDNLGIDDVVFTPNISDGFTFLKDGTTSVTNGSTINFGSALMGTATQQSFTLAGNATSFYQLTTAGSNVTSVNSGAFTLTTAPPSTLAPGASANVIITYNRSATYETVNDAGTFTFTSNAPGQTPFQIQLTGTNTPPPPVVAVTAVNNAGNGTLVRGSTGNVLYGLQLSASLSNATISGLNISASGTVTSADLPSGYKLIYSDDDALDASDAVLQSKPFGLGSLSFNALGLAVPANTTAYLFITADVASSAVLDHILNISDMPLAGITMASGSFTGTDPANTGAVFTISPPAGYYASAGSGNWASVSGWLFSPDSLNYVPATYVPGNDALHVSILNGHKITLTSSVSVKNISVENGGALYAKTFALTGAGNINIKSGGTFETMSAQGIALSGSTGAIRVTGNRKLMAGSHYIFDGTSAQITGTGFPSSIGSLVSTNSSGLTLSAPVAISDSLKIAAGNFNANSKKLTLLSSAAKTAALAPVINGASISNASNFTAQRWINPSTAILTGAFAMIGSPVSGVKASSWNTGVNPYGEATYIPYPTPKSSVLFYSPTDNSGASQNGWRKPTSAAETVLPGRGALVFFYNTFMRAGSVYELTGTPVTGNYSFPALQYCASGCPGVTAGNPNSWNLVANPYAATIDWDAAAGWTKTNIAGAVYVWQHEQKHYSTYLAGSPGINGGSNLIPAGQGFFIKATAASPALTIKESAKNYRQTAMLRNAAANNHLSFALNSSTGFKDEAIVVFNNNALKGYEADK
ncbi:MAG: hypothetical protein V4543_18155, partial [Bacteroidota bacterium]